MQLICFDEKEACVRCCIVQ